MDVINLADIARANFDGADNVFARFSDLLYKSNRVSAIFNRKNRKHNFQDALIQRGSLKTEELDELIEDFRFTFSQCLLAKRSFDYQWGKQDEEVFRFANSFADEINDKVVYLKEHLTSTSISQLLFSWLICRLGLVLFASNTILETRLSEGQKLPLHNGTYYRGQPDASFALIPSIYRGLKEKECTLNQKSLEKLYKDARLAEKYEQISNRSLKGGLDYQFLSYVQHACAYSPFLDFTSDEGVAEVFATYHTNINALRYNDAALFFFRPSEAFGQKESDFLLSQYRVSYRQGKLHFGSLIFGTPIWLCRVSDFQPSFAFIDSETNDRMKYQRGSFLFVYQCVIANNRICFTYNSGRFLKVVIPSALRKKLYDRVVSSRPHLQYRYLMDPYLYLSECL